MALIAAPISFSDTTVDKTTETLHAWRVKNFPNAIKYPTLHLTLLYHGHPIGQKLEAQYKILPIKDLQLQGQITALYPIIVDDLKVYVITLNIECEKAQELHLDVKTKILAATGEQAKMHPHLSPEGKSVYKNDYRPHFTLAKYETKQAMEEDLKAFSPQAFDALVGVPVTIGGFYLTEKK